MVKWLRCKQLFQRVQGHLLTFRIRHVCCHSNGTHAPIANPPNSAQLGGTLTISQTYIWVRVIVYECSERHTDRHTDIDGCGQYTLHLAIPNAICTNLNPVCTAKSVQARYHLKRAYNISAQYTTNRNIMATTRRRFISPLSSSLFHTSVI